MIIVRSATEDDAGQMVALLNEIIARGGYTAMDEFLSLEEQRGFIRTFPKCGVFHAAVDDDGRILGIQDVVPQARSGTDGHVGEISTFVRLDVRGRGIGRLLSEATFAAARRSGFEKLMATVRADNRRALDFYLGRGFRMIGIAERRARINGRDVDQAILERPL